MTETYSVSSDFGGIAPNIAQLDNQIINDPAITTDLIGISLNADVVDIIFVSTISGSEKTALDNLVSNYILDNTFGLNPVGTLNAEDGSGSTISILPGATGNILVSQPGMTGSGALEYVSPIPSNFIDGLTLNRNSVSIVRVDEGTARDSTDTVNIILPDFKTADITTSGTGGLDTGTESADTWYAIHVIGDSKEIVETDTLLSTSVTGPTLPPGFDTFRRVGWVRNDASSDFLDWEQTGTGRTRRIHYDETINTQQVLNDGSATTMTDIDLSSFVPPTSSFTSLMVEFQTGSAGTNTDFVRLRRKGFDTVGPIRLRTGVVSSAPASWLIGLPCNNNQRIQYLVTDGTNNQVDISVTCFEDDI